jgi:NADPH:quinone reductase-like Zn-dependent oxidoreductase
VPGGLDLVAASGVPLNGLAVAQIADLIARTASGELPARVHAVVPLDQVADAHREVAKGGVRGRYVLRP